MRQRANTTALDSLAHRSIVVSLVSQRSLLDVLLMNLTLDLQYLLINRIRPSCNRQAAERRIAPSKQEGLSAPVHSHGHGH